MQRNNLKKKMTKRAATEKNLAEEKERVNTKNALNQIKIRLNDIIESIFNKNDHFVDFVTFLI